MVPYVYSQCLYLGPWSKTYVGCEPKGNVGDYHVSTIKDNITQYIVIFSLVQYFPVTPHVRESAKAK